jgi:DtxR family Mn-dependent transcriptional regulator
MLGRLTKERLVKHVPRAGARLTPLGRREALAIVRRHRILETFLVRVLGVDWAEAHHDAEVLEHHVSDRVLAAIDRLIGHPDEDPHGHPIPDSRGRLRRRELIPLSRLRRGERAVVRELRDAGPPVRERAARMKHWQQIGLVPGAVVRMRSVRPLDDVLELQVGSHRLVTGSEGVEGVLVELRRSPGVRHGTRGAQS